MASLASIINNISLLKAFPDALGEDFANKKQLEDLGENFDPEDLQLMYQIAIFGRRDFEWAPDEFAGFSMTVLRMLAFKPLESEFLQEENPGQEKKENQKKKITKRTDDFVRVNSKFVEDWPNYVKKLKLGGMAGMLANNCTLIDYKENVLEFVVPEGLSNLLTDAYKQKFKKALDVSLDKNVDMRFSIAKVVETPASLEIKEKKDKADSAADSLKKDVFVSELMADFDAKIVEDSIKLKDK